MLNSRARRNAWRALLGVTTVEGAALIWSFHGAAWLRIVHYVLTPPGNEAAWALASATTVVYIAYAMFGLPFIRARAFSPEAWRRVMGLKLFAILMALVTGFFEEAFFRRFLMDLAMHDGAGAAAQIAISALLFGLAHGVWALFGGIRAGLGAIISTSILGALLAVTYLAGGRSLLPCAAGHVAINLVLEPWLILAATSGSWGLGAESTRL